MPHRGQPSAHCHAPAEYMAAKESGRPGLREEPAIIARIRFFVIYRWEMLRNIRRNILQVKGGEIYGEIS